MNKCQCGCGQDCNMKYVVGHNRRGKVASVETIEKRKKTLSLPEIKEKQILGIKKSWTEEKRQRARDYNLGKTLSNEHKEKIGKSNCGKIRSEKTKKRISNTLKGTGVGSNNPNWNGGTSRCYKTGYYSIKYINWRKMVFERDNYKCVECGKVGDYLTAHHIKSFARYPKLRFVLNNGLTLCEDCHSKTDNYKGRNRKGNFNKLKVIQ